MPRPVPTRLWHFTHVDHLASIARDGMVCDSDAHVAGRLTTEVGDQGVKERRRQKRVDVVPGGVVADYVPFYFTPRNLMLFQIHTGKVETYTGGQDGLVFLCTTLERIIDLDLQWVASNRNAATALAAFVPDLPSLDTHVDWALATTSTFKRTPDDPDRPQRHQAELLVHGRLPWKAIQFIGTRTEADLSRVEKHIGNLGGHQPQRGVRPRWYF